VLVIPPLRERREDVAVLTRHYVATVCGGDIAFEAAALDRLRDYDWPGNVRQLYTVLRVALRVEPQTLSAEVVAHVLQGFAGATCSRRCDAGSPSPLGGAVQGATPASFATSAHVGVVIDAGGAGRGAYAGSGMHAPADQPQSYASEGTPPLDGVAEGDVDAATRRRWPGFHVITARIQRRALLEAYEAAAGNKTAAGVLLGFHLSPGEEHVPGQPLTESRRNLALRKFRYWSGRLGIAASLSRRPSQAALADLCQPSQSVVDGAVPPAALEEP
jgi:DNA-binding NtrC family response regulator